MRFRIPWTHAAVVAALCVLAWSVLGGTRPGGSQGPAPLPSAEPGTKPYGAESPQVFTPAHQTLLDASREFFNRRPVFWAFYVTNFVFWIGISHAGTLISAILRLANATWRRPVTRCAEVITGFALSIGAMFPIIHLGRPWEDYWGGSAAICWPP